uniref:Uncharacterized protein n=1 Tax=Eptatretus burgeri TaxID=7764 RepID=A0A8C4NAJ0_EPTBU
MEKQKQLLHEVTMLEKKLAKQYQQVLAPDLLVDIDCRDSFEEDRLLQFNAKSLEELTELQASMCRDEEHEGQPLSSSRPIQMTTQQMEETLAFFRTQNEELKLKVDRETWLIDQYKEMQTVLEKKIQLCKPNGKDANQRAKDEMKQKIFKAKGYCDKLQKLLMQFLSDYYPQPTCSVASYSANQKNTVQSSSESGSQFLSLLEILKVCL